MKLGYRYSVSHWQGAATVPESRPSRSHLNEFKEYSVTDLGSDDDVRLRYTELNTPNRPNGAATV